MPLKWEIAHRERLVTVTGAGYLAREELEEYYDALVVADAMPYAKIFDVSAVTMAGTDDDFMMFGARMSAYTSILEIGPLAFVVTTPEVRHFVQRCLNLAPANRPVKMFASDTQARRWLDEQRGVAA